MIRVRRLGLDNADIGELAAWQQRLRGCRVRDPAIRERWNEFNETPLRVRIDQRLDQQSYGKCIYCEYDGSKIDHFYPKLTYPQRTFDWANLNRACTDCNFLKGPHLKISDGRPHLLNPMDEETESLIYIDPETGIMTASYGLDPEEAERVTYTIGKFKLNDRGLPRRRQEVAVVLELVMLSLTEAGNPRAEEALLHLLEEVRPLRAVVRQLLGSPGEGLRPLLEACMNRSANVRQYVQQLNF